MKNKTKKKVRKKVKKRHQVVLINLKKWGKTVKNTKKLSDFFKKKVVNGHARCPLTQPLIIIH